VKRRLSVDVATLKRVVAFELHSDEPAAPRLVLAPAVRAGPEPPRDEVEPLDGQLSRLHVTVSRRLLEKREAAKDAFAHSFPSGGAAEIMEHALDVALAQHAKRKGFVEKPLKTPRPCRTDAITADVSRAVWTRAGDRCEVVLPSGERCDSIADDDWPDLRPRRRHAARPRASGTRAGHAWRETFRPLASRAPIARHRFRHSAPVRRPGLRLEPARILRLPQAGAFSTSVAPVSATEVL
jgi:hypothetical protein